MAQVSHSHGNLGSFFGGIAGFFALGISIWSLATAMKARSDLFEPRLVVSRLVPSNADGSTGRLSIRNIGAGEALDVRCHIVNPFSERDAMKYDYLRFSAPLNVLAASGDTLEEATNEKRIRMFNYVLRPGEEQEMPVSADELGINMRIPEFFLVVGCAYIDKDRTKHYWRQEIETGGVIYFPTAEMDEPARKIWAEYQFDRRVQSYRKHEPSFEKPITHPTPTRRAAAQ